MRTATGHSLEVLKRAVRMIFDQRADHGSQWAENPAHCHEDGCQTGTLRLWVSDFIWVST